MKTRSSLRRRQGFALVITLVVVALLTIIITAFLTTATNDRLISRVYLGREQAAAAARGGAEEAMAVIKESFELYPDAATYWDPEQVQLTPSGFAEGTSLFIRATANSSGTAPERDPAKNTPDPTNSARQTWVLPLVSGVPDRLPKLVTGKATIVPPVDLGIGNPNGGNGVDLNVARSPGDNLGWIGSPPDWTGTKPKPVPAKWQEVLGPNGTVVARYAWWAEDDSFRLNANTSNADNASGLPKRADNDPQTVPMKAGQLSLAGPLKAAGATPADAQSKANNIATVRQSLPGNAFVEPAPFGYGATPPTTLEQDKLRYLTTNWSSSINASRYGAFRLNINDLRAGRPDQPATVQPNVERIIQAIGFQLPKFGQRFYRLNAGLNDDNVVSGTVAAGHAQRYFYKLGANIRDYIDADRVPTIFTVNASGRYVLAPSTKPNEHPGDATPPPGLPPGYNPIYAMGKEAGLYIQEGAVKFNCTVSGTSYTLNIDYYIEVWNPSDKDIAAADLGTTPFLKISRPPGWVDNRGNQKIPDGANDPGRDIEIPLTGVFRAGSCTVVTTHPTEAFPGNVIRGGASQRTFTGSFPSGGYIDLSFRSTGASDYETSVIIGCNEGLIDGAMGCIPTYNNNSRIRFNASGVIGPLGGTLLGNTMTPSQLGDPRSNNEYIKGLLWQAGGFASAPDQVRYINSGTGFPLNLGTPPARNSVDPGANQVWPDYYNMPTTGSPNPGAGMSVVADEKMLSIGELGNVYDPARKRGTYTAADIEAARGGARTLKIGQHDDLIDPTPLSLSSEQWAAWRLCDIFTVFDDQQLAGTINPNGLLRDNGAALKALLTGFSFQGVNPGTSTIHGDPAVAGRSFDAGAAAGADALITELKARLRRMAPAAQGPIDLGVTWGPLFERGELSELTIWGRNASGDSRLTGADMSRVSDRAREETYRRVSEQVCTRGNTYTVYAVGQAIQQATATSKKIVTGTQRLRITFRINPTYPATATGSGFDPNSPTAVRDRFARPTQYAVEILEVIPGI